MNRKFLYGALVGGFLAVVGLGGLILSSHSPVRAFSSKIYRIPGEPSIQVLRRIGTDDIMVEYETGRFVDYRVYLGWTENPIEREKQRKEIREHIRE